MWRYFPKHKKILIYVNETNASAQEEHLLLWVGVNLPEELSWSVEILGFEFKPTHAAKPKEDKWYW